MASRTSPSTRPPAPRKASPAKRSTASATPSGGQRLLSGLGRGLSALWLALAHAVGGVARRVGSSARDLDPAHRRDGVGLLVLAFAVIVAATTWWGLDGPVAGLVDAVVTGLTGVLAVLVPLLLVALGVRILRHPDTPADNGRIVIGSLAITTAVLGLIGVSAGSPGPGEGLEAMKEAGGLIGAAVSVPLTALIGPWVAGAVLVLLLGFGLLVVTATPLAQVPARLAELRDLLLLRTPAPVVDVRGRTLDLRDPMAPLDLLDDDSDVDDQAVADADTGEHGESRPRRGAGLAAGFAGMASLFSRRKAPVVPEVDPERDRPFDSALITPATHGADLEDDLSDADGGGADATEVATPTSSGPEHQTVILERPSAPGPAAPAQAPRVPKQRPPRVEARTACPTLAS